jgi:hypothetical protein
MSQDEEIRRLRGEVAQLREEPRVATPSKAVAENASRCQLAVRRTLGPTGNARGAGLDDHGYKGAVQKLVAYVCRMYSIRIGRNQRRSG